MTYFRKKKIQKTIDQTMSILEMAIVTAELISMIRTSKTLRKIGKSIRDKIKRPNLSIVIGPSHPEETEHTPIINIHETIPVSYESSITIGDHDTSEYNNDAIQEMLSYWETAEIQHPVDNELSDVNHTDISIDRQITPEKLEELASRIVSNM